MNKNPCVYIETLLVLMAATVSSFHITTLYIFLFQAWVVERMGRFHRVLEPGINVLIPLLDKVKYVQSLKEIAIDVPKQGAITSGTL